MLVSPGLKEHNRVLTVLYRTILLTEQYNKLCLPVWFQRQMPLILKKVFIFKNTTNIPFHCTTLGYVIFFSIDQFQEISSVWDSLYFMFICYMIMRRYLSMFQNRDAQINLWIVHYYRCWKLNCPATIPTIYHGWRSESKWLLVDLNQEAWALSIRCWTNSHRSG